MSSLSSSPLPLHAEKEVDPAFVQYDWIKRHCPLIAQPKFDISNGNSFVCLFYQLNQHTHTMECQLVFESESSYNVSKGDEYNLLGSFFYRSYNHYQYGRTADINAVQYHDVHLEPTQAALTHLLSTQPHLFQQLYDNFTRVQAEQHKGIHPNNSYSQPHTRRNNEQTEQTKVHTNNTQAAQRPTHSQQQQQTQHKEIVHTLLYSSYQTHSCEHHHHHHHHHHQQHHQHHHQQQQHQLHANNDNDTNPTYHQHHHDHHQLSQSSSYSSSFFFSSSSPSLNTCSCYTSISTTDHSGPQCWSAGLKVPRFLKFYSLTYHFHANIHQTHWYRAKMKAIKKHYQLYLKHTKRQHTSSQPAHTQAGTQTLKDSLSFDNSNLLLPRPHSLSSFIRLLTPSSAPSSTSSSSSLSHTPASSSSQLSSLAPEQPISTCSAVEKFACTCLHNLSENETDDNVVAAASEEEEEEAVGTLEIQVPLDPALSQTTDTSEQSSALTCFRPLFYLNTMNHMLSLDDLNPQFDKYIWSAYPCYAGNRQTAEAWAKRVIPSKWTIITLVCPWMWK